MPEKSGLGNPDSATENLLKVADQKPPSDDCRTKEIGGPKGPEPTRYGDWEKAGRCIDF